MTITRKITIEKIRKEFKNPIIKRGKKIEYSGEISAIEMLEYININSPTEGFYYINIDTPEIKILMKKLEHNYNAQNYCADQYIFDLVYHIGNGYMLIANQIDDLNTLHLKFKLYLNKEDLTFNTIIKKINQIIDKK